MLTAAQYDVFGFLKSGLDAHTMGVRAAYQLITDCGYKAVLADQDVCCSSEGLQSKGGAELFEGWMRNNRISILSCSYRLDPRAGVDWFCRIVKFLADRRLLVERGGMVHGLAFAGLPETCALVQKEVGCEVAIFPGGESPRETLLKSGVSANRIPNSIVSNSVYDEARISFGRDLIATGKHLGIKPQNRSGYPEFGTSRDSLESRIAHAKRINAGPLFRAHMGPFLANRIESIQLFLSWVKQVAADGYLDVLSIGTSQLTQSHFGRDWGCLPNGGGVPINSEQEYVRVWEAARPMLVRTYAGTRDLANLAQMYDRTIHNAWHALSLWWFCAIDGRGDYSLAENLAQQFAALKVVAKLGKPFEPNVPHHFAFRGADDVSYVVSAVLAARVAKKVGIRTMVLQNMLNNPANTWGVQDLAKARAMLRLVRELEDSEFCVIYQPRTGLGYFAPDLDKARVQLAAATALMDDVDPLNEHSPNLIHVVSFSEAVSLATPAIIKESVQITQAALSEYRMLRRKGLVDDMSQNQEVNVRTEDLVSSARKILAAIDATIPCVESPIGLYEVFRAGFLPVPDLTYCRDEFPHAVAWKTQFHNGGYKVLSGSGRPLSPNDFLCKINELYRAQPNG